jgi:ribosomal protein S18 acetylase RimI-like enzyme
MAAAAEIAARTRRAVRAGYAVRPMQPTDAPTVAAAHVRVWREAYASLMPAEHLAGLDEAELAARWHERLTRPATDGVRHLVGLDPGGRIVGLATAGQARDPEPATAWELWAINVLARAHGTGLADLLMTELTGSRDCYLWVVRGNTRAMAFYRRHGFVADGGTKLHPPTGLTEERMVRIGSG